jgi:trans-aconitate methyltransferase
MDETIETYNKAAEAYAEKFNSIGSRQHDIERAIQLWGKMKKPAVVEWGCGNGRDAAVICEFSSSFVGIDASSEMIRLAQTDLPDIHFEVADIGTYETPANTDIIFAFASLLHFDKVAVRSILKRAHAKLNDEGLVYISLKQAPYEERIVTDTYGDRVFYFYERKDMDDLAEGLYEIVHYEEKELKEVQWLTCGLKKKPL